MKSLERELFRCSGNISTGFPLQVRQRTTQTHFGLSISIPARRTIFSSPQKRKNHSTIIQMAKKITPESAPSICENQRKSAAKKHTQNLRLQSVKISGKKNTPRICTFNLC
jgi:hypothetical protein